MEVKCKILTLDTPYRLNYRFNYIKPNNLSGNNLGRKTLDANITAKISKENIRSYFRNLRVNKLRIMTEKKSGLNLRL